MPSVGNLSDETCCTREAVEGEAPYTVGAFTFLVLRGGRRDTGDFGLCTDTSLGCDKGSLVAENLLPGDL